LLEEAAAAAAEGDVETAESLYSEILSADENNAAAIAGLAKLHLDQGDLDRAKATLTLATGAAAQDSAVAGIRAAIDLAEQSADLGEISELQRRVEARPEDHQARFDLALALNAKGRKDEAADALLDIVRKDRGWNDDGARKQLLQFFEAWGFTDPASVAGRRKLSGILFR
jgi:putative thioredoxin